jgi:hypothetical protein
MQSDVFLFVVIVWCQPETIHDSSVEEVLYVFPTPVTMYSADAPVYVTSHSQRRCRTSGPRADVWDPLGVELNADIIGKQSAQEVLAAFDRRGAQFSEVNALTALHRVARHMSDDEFVHNLSL